MDRRSLILGGAGLVFARPAFADTAPIHSKVRLTARPRSAVARLADRAVDLDVSLEALQPIALLTTGDFVDDGFHVSVTSPGGASALISAITRRPGEIGARDLGIRTLQPGEAYASRYRILTRLAFPAAGTYRLQVSYAAPDPARPNLRRQNQRLLASGGARRLRTLQAQAGDLLLRPEDGEILTPEFTIGVA